MVTHSQEQASIPAGRKVHTVLAYLLFLTILAHLGAILFHTWVVRDGTFSRMAPWRVRS